MPACMLPACLPGRLAVRAAQPSTTRITPWRMHIMAYNPVPWPYASTSPIRHRLALASPLARLQANVKAGEQKHVRKWQEQLRECTKTKEECEAQCSRDVHRLLNGGREADPPHQMPPQDLHAQTGAPSGTTRTWALLHST